MKKKVIYLSIIISMLLLNGCVKVDETTDQGKISYEIEKQEGSLVQVMDGERKILIQDVFDFLGNPTDAENLSIYSFFDNTIILKGTGEGVAGSELNSLFKISLDPLGAKRLQNKPFGGHVVMKIISPSGRYLLSPDVVDYPGDEYEFRSIFVYDLLKDTETLLVKLPQEESLTEGYEVVNYLPLIVGTFTIGWEDENTIRYNVYSAKQELVKPSDRSDVGSHGPPRPLLETRTISL